jgi:hypothetical protein
MEASRTLDSRAHASIYAVVKGSADAAKAMAQLKGIPCEVAGRCRTGEVLLRIPDGHAEAVYQWAVEPSSYPYRSGTCLGVMREQD